MNGWAAATLWILGAEGGQGNDPADHGGPTNFGISKAEHPDVDIATLTRERALEIYRSDYWTPIRGDQLPIGLAVAVFDAAVLQGPHKAVLWLQKALVKVGLDDVVADGLMGPKTVRSAQIAAEEDLAATLAEYLSFRGTHMLELALNDATQRKFLRGWLARLFRLEAACLRGSRHCESCGR